MRMMRALAAPHPERFPPFVVMLGLLLAIAEPLAAQQPSRIVRDGSMGGPGEPTATPDGGGTRFEVGESLGRASGANLFHSFSFFDIAAGDTVRFSADPGSTFRNVISRVTGGASRIDGTLESTIPGADFYLLNPQGVFFGEGARIDVPASFYVSSADTLGFEDGGSLDLATPTTPPALSPVDPSRFGFLGDGAGMIGIEGFLSVGDGRRLAVVGGDIVVDGGALVSLGGEVILSSIASDGRFEFGPASGAPPRQVDVRERGEIRIVDEAFVSSAGLSPSITQLNDASDPESQLILVEGFRVPASSPVGPPEGTILLADTPVAGGQRQLLYYRTNPNAPALARGAGSIRVEAASLALEDADIGNLTVGADSGSIDIDLTGDLTITKRSSTNEVGLSARTGARPDGYRLRTSPPSGVGCAGAVIACRVVDPQNGVVEFGPLSLDLTGNTGAGGEIRIAATDVHLENGATIATSSLGGGAPGAIIIEARGDVALEGLDPDFVPGPDRIAGSTIVSNHQGEPAGPAGQTGGRIEIQADTLTLREGSGIAAQTTGDGDAGDIVVDVRRLTLFDDAQIDSSTSGQRLPPGSSDTTSGEGGRITVEASEAVLLAGTTQTGNAPRLSTFSQARSTGGAGRIRIETPELLLRDGARIAVTTAGEGEGGDLVAEVGRFRATGGSSLSASSESTAQPAGDVEVRATGTLRLESGSSVTADTGIASGGNVRLVSGDVMLAGENTTIAANAAQLGGSGGRVEIAAPVLVRAASSTISAVAPGGPEVQGEVEIDATVIYQEEPVRPPEAPLLDASALLLSRCDARRGDARAGRFQVASWPDEPLAPTGSLLAWDRLVPELGDGLGARADEWADADPSAEDGTAGPRIDPAREPGHPALLVERLEDTLAMARRGGDDGSLVRALLGLGALRAELGAWQSAAALHEEAAERAAASGDVSREVQARSNRARALLAADEPTAAVEALFRARARVEALDAGREATALRIHVAEGHAMAAEQLAGTATRLLPPAHRLLLAASARARALDARDLEARAFGALGRLYALESDREREALYLYRRAIAAAEEGRDAVQVAHWSHLAARTAWQAGREDEALQAHRRAVAMLEVVRPLRRVRGGGSDSGFRQTVAPVYLDLVDVLLRLSDERPDARQTLLAEARDTVEHWKAAELRDYFRDDCAAELAAQARPLEQVDDRVAVVYPILFDDRLELLVGTRRGLSRHVGSVGRAEVEERTRALRSLLVKRTTSQFRPRAQALHALLVEPFRGRLAAESIETLVFVPDGVLRTIPFGALHDGERFLVEDYAVAVTPTLQLLAPRRLDPARTSILLAGLSEPVQGFAPLEHVPGELSAIESRFGGEVLLDEAFRRDRFDEALRERRPGIVHIASHARFGGDPEDSFVLTHDGRLGLDDLTRLVAANRYGDEPVEMLLLSACETAAGDDRAALGLAGLAVRAGARSALGSLWQVDDQATSELITAFYSELAKPDVSKAEAFARAQRGLIADRRFRHPYYWAGFTVINNWL